MPPKKSTTSPAPVKVKAGKTKAAPPKVNKPVIIPHRPATAPAEKLVPRRGWKGPPLPFNDIDGALAWGFGNEKLADAEDQADAYQASDTHHRARTKAAEDELRTLPKRDAAGVLRSRAERHEQNRAGPAVPGAPAAVARKVRAGARREAAAPEPPAPAGPKKKEQEPATAGPSSAPAGPKKEPPPAPAGPKKEPAPESSKLKFPVLLIPRRAAEMAEEASQAEEEFREGKAQMEKDLARFRVSNLTAKQAIPAELKQRHERYTSAALKKLTDARLAAEERATEALLANPGVTQRKKAKGKK